jgi:serine acetyltransferase
MPTLHSFNAADEWERISKGSIKARYISPFSILLHKNGVYPKIGRGTWIGHFTVIDGSQGLEIGENCDICCGVQIFLANKWKSPQ